MNAQTLIKALNLVPLPGEGGYFRRTFQSRREITLEDYGGKRPVMSCIYYLIVDNDFSHLHRLRSDEVWTFHGGDSAEMIRIAPDGALERIGLGYNFQIGETLQTVVEPDHWQGARLKPGGKWALFSCVVGPGFESRDFELADRSALTAQFPQHAPWIEKYTQPNGVAHG